MKNIFKMLLITVALMCTSCVTRVDAGHAGLEVRLSGQERGVSDIKEVSGWVLYNPIKSQIKEIPTFTQTKDYDEFLIRSQDGTVFTADPTISYYIDSQKATSIYRQYRVSLADIENSYIKGVVRDCYRTTAGLFSADSMMSNMGKFEEMIQDRMISVLSKDGFILQQLTSNVIPPKSLTEAIEKKNKATQDAIAAENRKREAAALAENVRIEAQGNADAIKIKAEAEAYANKLLSSSLSQQVVDIKRIEKWDGAYPSTMTGTTSMVMGLK
ncbi:MAG: SPFH domain-containing protein [Bacteroidales bacterium]